MKRTAQELRKKSPIDVKTKKLLVGETIARYSKGVMIGKWRDKRRSELVIYRVS